MEAYGTTHYNSAASNGQKLFKRPAVQAQIEKLRVPLTKIYSPDVVRAEFAVLYETSKSELIKARCLENLARFNGMYVEKTINVNANVTQNLPDLKNVPLDQLEREFIGRMKLESTGIETFARKELQATEFVPLIAQGSIETDETPLIAESINE